MLRLNICSVFFPTRPHREPTPHFDLHRNSGQRATHGLYVDVQSGLVSTSTRWRLPLFFATTSTLSMTQAQWAMTVDEHSWVVDAPNVLAVPKAKVREHRDRLARQSVRMADNQSL